MQKGTIRRQKDSRVIGHWHADSKSIVVETDEPELRRAADEILKRPQTIPIHAAEHYEFAGGAVPLIETPSSIKFLALFALEMEERGFELEPEDE
jgi:hypothetical protein